MNSAEIRGNSQISQPPLAEPFSDGFPKKDVSSLGKLDLPKRFSASNCNRQPSLTIGVAAPLSVADERMVNYAMADSVSRIESDHVLSRPAPRTDFRPLHKS